MLKIVATTSDAEARKSMLRDFNLLATTSRGSEQDASSELCYLLCQAGDSTPHVERTRVSGLICAKTTLSPFDAIDSLRRILHERPYEFRYTLRIIPIERVVRTNLDEIQRVVVELASKIAENETFRVTVEKRYSAIRSQVVIQIVAAEISGKVDLGNPDKILLIEIVGGLTGISVTEPSSIISVLKEKML